MKVLRIKTYLEGTRRWTTLLLTTSLLALAAAACNGGDDDSDGPAATGSTATQDSNGSSGNGDLEELMGKYLDGADGMVHYQVDSENFGSHPQGVWTTYRLGSNVREDWATNDFLEAPTIAIKSDDGMFFCSQTPFTSSCTQVQNESDLDLVFIVMTPLKDVPAALAAGDLDYDSSALPDEEFDGVTGKCFDVTTSSRVPFTNQPAGSEGPPGTEQIKLCFSDEGQLLAIDRHVKFEAENLPDAYFKATSDMVGEAQDSDFEPPTPPVNGP